MARPKHVYTDDEGRDAYYCIQGEEVGAPDACTLEDLDPVVVEDARRYAAEHDLTFPPPLVPGPYTMRIISYGSVG
jgi:hypothetical protein